MFNKIGSHESSELKAVETKAALADPIIIDRFNKFAQHIKNIAPKSDDFLYFSIIFLKSAEASLIDENGETKKLAGGEHAWGYFDDNWKWHGNVKPHRNNNGDIFPEVELKKAASSWIGLPLCKDHESSSVDGIRGIILDTHYDEKLKQVVGLCALDKVNYPDLARKVETGMVRYGSMGTAVETSVCTECANKATTQDEYCTHILNRTAHGEINVGLNPIEYSLVVQPAEPGAKLLRCIASLKNYKDEFINHGVKDFDAMIGGLSERQALQLDGIMKTACGENGCSIKERRTIVASFLKKNNLVKNAEVDPGELVALYRASKEAKDSDPDISDGFLRLLREKLNMSDADIESAIGTFANKNNAIDQLGVPTPGGDTVTDPLATAQGYGSPSLIPSSSETNDYTGSSSTSSIAGISEDSSERLNLFDAGGSYRDGVTPVLANNDGSTKQKINTILEEIMNESRLRKRAEHRRRIAYHQGGSEGVEPNTYKSEDYKGVRDNQDKQMLQDGNMGGADGMVPGDSETKEKLSRAELEERRLRRMAYHQGGADGVEPNTYKSEDYKGVRDNQDKQMLQDGNMGGADGMVPGDSETKEKLSRASLRTRFSQKRNLDGTINKRASVFEVFAGNERVLSATAGEIFGRELNENWSWVTSADYGKEVVKEIRASGLSHVAGLLKSAQDAAPPEMPELPPLDDAGAEPPPADMGMEAPADMGAPDTDLGLDDAAEEAGADDELPAPERAERTLMEIEDGLAELREIIKELSGEASDVNIKIDMEKGQVGGEEDDAQQLSLASNVLNQLKLSFSEMHNSADELAMIVETYDGISKLSGSQKKDLGKITVAAIRDANVLCGESKALCRVAKEVSGSMVKTSEYVEEPAAVNTATGNVVADSTTVVEQQNELVSEALELRKNRREAVLKSVEDRELSDRRAKREAIAKQAQESYGHMPAVEEDMEAAADDMEAAAYDDMEAAADDGQVAAADDGQVAAADDGQVAAADDGLSATATLKSKLNETVIKKQAEENRQSYRLKLRRAYDLAMDMQRKGLIPLSKVALDKQVDEVMLFDDVAFEAFKRSIANAKSVKTMKIASDLGGVNVGVKSSDSSPRITNIEALASMWE